jgi:dTDP-4-amino-4,6-dideoxygalactose transaminase
MIKFLELDKITQKYQPELSDAINRVINSGCFVLGREVNSFESEFSEFIGSRHCIGVANGLDALRLILRAYIELGDLKEGDEVIVPANTYIASILAVTDNRLKPVLAEPDINTFNLDISNIEKHITENTKAIMVVHLYGRACWSEELEKLADKYHLKIIEDNAQAAGAMIKAQGAGHRAQGTDELKLRRTGSLGHAAGHSFYPSKNLGALGDGGAVTTDNDDLANVIRTLANYGANKKNINEYKGINSRLDEIQAAVLRVKLARLDADNQKRRVIAQFYLNNIKNPEIILPEMLNAQYSTLNASYVWHLFVIRHPKRDKLKEWLFRNEIESLIHYPIPPHKQRSFNEWNNKSFPVTEQIHKEVLSIPLNKLLLMEEAEKIVDCINRYKS